MWTKVQRMALLCGAFCMAVAPLLLDAASTPTLNHYSDYGVVEQSGSANNGKLSIGNDPFGYSDEYTDNESGLQYLQVRYYDPAIMRFTAMDTYPLLNRYAYANENPIMNDDPTGHSAVGAGSSSSGVKGWEGSLIGMGVGGGIGLIGGIISSVFSIATEGASLYAAFAVEALIGGASGAGGQEAQTAAEHEKANGLQLGIAAAGGAVMSAIGFGLGKYFSDTLKPTAGAEVGSGGAEVVSDEDDMGPISTKTERPTMTFTTDSSGNRNRLIQNSLYQYFSDQTTQREIFLADPTSLELPVKPKSVLTIFMSPELTKNYIIYMKQMLEQGENVNFIGAIQDGVGSVQAVRFINGNVIKIGDAFSLGDGAKVPILGYKPIEFLNMPNQYVGIFSMNDYNLHMGHVIDWISTQ